MTILNKLLERTVRNYIRAKMRQHKLKDVFSMIQKEYTFVYHEDNLPTRLDYLAELVNETSPKRFGYKVDLVKEK